MSLLVFKIMKPSASFHGIAYNDKKQQKGDADLLYCNNFRHLQEEGRVPSRTEAIRFMEAFCSGNTRIRNKQFHAILSCKGKSITNERLKTYGLEIITKMGYANNPVMIYGHNDTPHNHIHIVTTRIGPDGRKIAHNFERKRSCEILQQIMVTDYKKKLMQDIGEVSKYHCSTIFQYQLLFEMKGYDTKVNNDNLELYKYGSFQGTVKLAELQNLMQRRTPANIAQLKALLYKYKRQYNSKLKKKDPQKYTSAKTNLQSDLTRFMKHRFGMEFIFFTSKAHEIPYGYVIIDHNNKAVLKGSEVMKLQNLIQETRAVDQKPDLNAINETHLNQQGVPENNQELLGHDVPKTIYIPNIPLTRLIDKIEKDVEQDLNKEEHTQMRRRGRFI